MNRRPTESRSGYDSFSPQHATFAAALPDNHFFDPRKKKSAARRLILWTALLLLAALAVNFIVNRFAFVERVEVPVQGLTASFDGYTILHVSDLKGRLFGEGQRMLRFALGSAEFDAVALTGDMVSPKGNAGPLYALIDMLRELRPNAPIYFIAGDDDPAPLSMEYAQGGSPFAPWVLGAEQRGAIWLSAPVSVQRGEQRLWLAASSQLNLDVDTTQRQYELQYLEAMHGGDENEIELTEHNLASLQQTRDARALMAPTDAYVVLTHVPPSAQELTRATPDSLSARIDLVLCGHYLGGLLRLPFAGPPFIPSQTLARYGLFPGKDTFSGLSYAGRTAVYVSRGLGSEDAHYPPVFFRLFNPPQMTLVTLAASAL